MNRLSFIFFIFISSILSAQVELESDLVLSSNPLKIKGGPAAQYISISPRYQFFKAFDSALFQAETSSSIRSYTDQKIQKNGGYAFLQQILSLKRFFDSDYEVGGLLGATILDARDIGFSVSDQSGRKLRSSSYKSQILIKKNWLSSWIQARADISNLIYQDKIIDEIGNLFKDDKVEERYEIQYSHDLTEFLKLGLTTYIKNRRYHDRRARFTEGTLNLTSDLLRETETGLDFASLYELDGLKISGQLNYSRNKDRNQGALDFERTGFKFGARVPFQSFIFFDFDYAQTHDTYENFVADVLTNPAGHNKRNDVNETKSIGIFYPLGKYHYKISYADEANRTNYSINDVRESKWQALLKVSYE